MIIVPLDRDQSRSIQQYFFVYLEEVCKMKVDQETNQDQKLLFAIIQDLFLQVKTIFEKKLLTAHNSFTYKFTDSQGIILYKLLKDIPIEEKQVYLVMLRQLILNIIYTKLPA